MASQPTQRVAWRGRLAIWLQAVVADAQLFGGNFQAAVQRQAGSFPKSPTYRFVRQYVARSAAKWLIKTALSDGAQAADLNVSPEAIDLIADLAIDLL